MTNSAVLLCPRELGIGCGLGVSGDLGGGELAVVGFLLVPRDCFGDGFLEVPDWFPTQEVVGFVGGKVEEFGFVHGFEIAFVLPGSRPMFEDFADEVGDGFVGVEGGAKVEGGLEKALVVGAESWLSEDRAEPEVTA